MRALPGCWIVRCESDWMEMVSSDMNSEGVFMVRFWPMFRWMFRALVSRASVLVVLASIWLASCFWKYWFRPFWMACHEKSLPSANRSRGICMYVTLRLRLKLEVSTWIGPWRLEIGVVVSGHTIGTRCVKIQCHCSLLQRSIHSLKYHPTEFVSLLPGYGITTHCQDVGGTLGDACGGRLHILVGHFRGHRAKSSSQLVALV